jgi:hypothetical protein
MTTTQQPAPIAVDIDTPRLLLSRFGRIEPRRTAQAYLSALLSNIERKNCRHLA